jgi:RNA polymerase sigma-70 factor (ECF subfamily)
MYNNKSDIELVDFFKKGNIQSFDIIMNKYEKKVFHICFTYFKDREEAIDVTQEIFIKIFKNLSKFKGKSKLFTWIYKISINTCKTKIKIWQKRFWLEAFSIDSQYTSEKGEFLYQFTTFDNNPENIFLEKENLKNLSEIIKTLPIKYRIPLLLRDIKGLSYDEISEIMSLNPGTLKSRIYRARDLIIRKSRQLEIR